MNKIHTLRLAGFKVRVTHKRKYQLSGKQMLSGLEFFNLHGDDLSKGSRYFEPLAKGGMTQVDITTPEGNNAFTIAHCNETDGYCRKTGAYMALERALTQLGVSVDNNANIPDIEHKYLKMLGQVPAM